MSMRYPFGGYGEGERGTGGRGGRGRLYAVVRGEHNAELEDGVLALCNGAS